MAEFIIKDFSAGWCPSDNASGGRKNALLRMESLELDENGAVVMTGGTKKVLSAFTNTLHTIYSKFMSSAQVRYSADTSGNIFRNNTNIGSSGSSTRAGIGSAYDFVIICSGNTRKRDDGTTATDLGQTASTVPAAANNGAGVLTGSYQYCQVNVYATGAYQARSAISPITATVVAAANKIQVTAISPTSPANEVWIFRRSTPDTGGNLAQFYRVKRLTSSYTTPFDDNMSDIEAVENGITANLSSLPVTSTNIADAILEVVGPVNGRMLYFTKNAVYFGEPNSPESYVPGQAVFFMGSATTAEIFQWAKKIGNNIVLIGTSKDIYRLTGTLITLPDGTLDVYIRPLGVDAPPISIDADIYNNTVVYMGPYGWVLCDQNGNIVQLCAPNTDRIYRGQTCYTMGGVPIYILPAYRYSCAVIRNKLYVRVPEIVSNDPANPFTYRMEVYDFVRKYWRVLKFPSNNAPLMLFGQEDDAVIGFFDDDKFIKQVDYQFAKTFDNTSSVKQTIAFLTTFQDANTPFNRKDVGTLKFKINTGGDAVTYTVYSDEDQTTVLKTGTITSSTLTEKIIDFSTTGLLLKTFQILLSGQIADFQLTEISLGHELRPEQKTFLKLLPFNFGIDSTKRIPDFAVVIDTLSQNITMTPYIDNVAQTAATLNSAYKKTIPYQFTGDASGVDLELVFTGGSNPFEFYEFIPPKNLEVFPQLTKYLVIPISNLGIATKKRVRVWPFILDPKGGTITFTPVVDGSNQSTSTHTGTGKKTYFHYFTDDQFGVDYSGFFSSSTAFEVWEIGKPEVVQVLPVGKRFDQVGPEELFRYGKIRKIRARILSEATGNIPYSIYFQDGTPETGNIAVTANIEDTYEIPLQKTIAGQILRIVLGNTSFTFYRYYIQVQVAKQGRDTENEWIQIPNLNG